MALPPHIKPSFLKGAILFLVFFSAVTCFTRLIRYYWIKKLQENNDLAEVAREYSIVEEKLSLMKFIPGASVVIAVLFWTGIPRFIPLIFLGFFLFMIVLSIISLQRMGRVKFHNQGVDKTVVQHKIESYPDEQIAGAIFGVMKCATSFGDVLKGFSKPFGVEILGSGKTYYPENSLLITDRRLLFIQVPLSGGNKIVDGVDYVQQNFLFNRGELRREGEEILKRGSLSKILELAINDVLYESIKTLTLNYAQITIEKITGEKLRYAFIDKEYADSLKKWLQGYLKEKFVCVEKSAF